VTASEAAAVLAAVSEFGDALALVQNPATKTEVTVANKDDARLSAEQIVRQFGIGIKYNAGISDGDKIAIGVRPVNNTRNPIPTPSSTPILGFIGSTADGAHTLRYSDTNTPDSRSKPFGAASMQLFVAIAATPVTDPEDAEFYAVFTRNPLSVGFDPADGGKYATYFARWCTARGEPGPWSAALSRRIAA
jgi:hypothetical protein